MKEHIAGPDTPYTLCGKPRVDGQWKAGAAYQGLRTLGVGPDMFCPECQRIWTRYNTYRKERENEHHDYSRSAAAKD
jgi:hypothetical protein